MASDFIFTLKSIKYHVLGIIRASRYKSRQTLCQDQFYIYHRKEAFNEICNLPRSMRIDLILVRFRLERIFFNYLGDSLNQGKLKFIGDFVKNKIHTDWRNVINGLMLKDFKKNCRRQKLNKAEKRKLWNTYKNSFIPKP